MELLAKFSRFGAIVKFYFSLFEYKPLHVACGVPGCVSLSELIEYRFYSFDASFSLAKTINTRKLSHISSRMSTDVIGPQYYIINALSLLPSDWPQSNRDGDTLMW